jgi:hypothetical protein
MDILRLWQLNGISKLFFCLGKKPVYRLEAGAYWALSSMKPFPFTYACPHCYQRLQSPNTDAGKTLSCHFCRKNFIAPKAPPRPLGGLLILYGVMMVLGTAFAFASIVFIPIGIPVAFGLYGFFKQRKWFVPFTLISNVSGLAIGMYYSLPTSVSCLLVAIYFLCSKRVRETFVI